MAARRVNPYRIKVHHCYSVSELALACHVHKNTVRNWQGNGLEPIDHGRPVLFQGATVRAFLSSRNASRKRPCPPGTLYCLRCREPRQPALGMVDYVPHSPDSGNLHAICGHCEARMHRKARLAQLAAIMPGLAVQIRQALPSLNGKPNGSLNCDKTKGR